MRTRKQATPMFTTLCVLVGVLVVVQLWLLSASLEAVLSGDEHTAIAGTFASLALFALSAGLLGYGLALDRNAQP